METTVESNEVSWSTICVFERGIVQDWSWECWSTSGKKKKKVTKWLIKSYFSERERGNQCP